MNPNECQFPSLQSIAEGNAPIPPQSLLRQLKLSIRRHMSPSQHRQLRNWFYMLKGQSSPAAKPAANTQTVPLMAGDQVRVRSMEEIEATLDQFRQTRGCTFMSEQKPYCGTIQRVLKPMERFVDEREMRAKKCKGLVLLDGVMCQGTTAFGRCDRSCFLFWREEWLEKIE